MDGDVASHLVYGPDPLVERISGEIIISHPEIVVFVDVAAHQPFVVLKRLDPPSKLAQS